MSGHAWLSAVCANVCARWRQLFCQVVAEILSHIGRPARARALAVSSACMQHCQKLCIDSVESPSVRPAVIKPCCVQCMSSPSHAGCVVSVQLTERETYLLHRRRIVRSDCAVENHYIVHGDIFTDQFSGPGRAFSLTCVCVLGWLAG